MINYLVVQPFYAMWQARMYGIYAQPEHEKIFRQIFVMYSLLLTYVALGLSVFSPEIVGLMADPKFASGRDVVPIVALAYVFYGIGFYVQLGMFLANRTKAIGAVSAVAAVLNLGLNYVLIGRFGMVGAAWATLLGFLIIAVGSYWFSQKALPLNLGMPRVLSGVLLAIGLYMIGWMEAAHSILFVIALKVCLVLSFPALVWKLRVLSPDEMGTLESMRDRATTILSRQAGLIWRRVTA
jgi:O-antigen/teichoic acid export membrane protein